MNGLYRRSGAPPDSGSRIWLPLNADFPAAQ
jgi:hypothetical protein